MIKCHAQFLLNIPRRLNLPGQTEIRHQPLANVIYSVVDKHPLLILADRTVSLSLTLLCWDRSESRIESSAEALPSLPKGIKKSDEGTINVVGALPIW